MGKKTQGLIERLQRLEKLLYTVWEEEKQRRWAKWVRKLNNLDHSKATRAFYAELNHKKMQHEQLGPIVNDKGQLSTSLEECMKNWRRFYKQLYSKGKMGNKTGVESDAKTNKSNSKLSKQQEEALDVEITMNEVVEAIFSLRMNTAAGSDFILTRDIHELLDTSKQSENWKNAEMLRYLHKMLQNMWNEEKVPPNFKETVLRPFLKDTEKAPTDPSNYRPVALLNICMKIYEHIIKERLVAVLEKNKFFSNVQAAYRKSRATSDHLLVVQELFFHYRYKRSLGQAKAKCPLYLCLMDLAKAFDTVPR